MARDYARKNNKRTSRSQEDTGGNRNWRWPLAGILIALFAAGVFYLKQQSDKLAAAQGDQGGSIIQQTMKKDIPETATPTTATTLNKTASSKTAAKTPAITSESTTAPPQPKFDFYTMLPQGQAGDASAKPNTASTVPANTGTAPASSVPAPKPATPAAAAPAPKSVPVVTAPAPAPAAPVNNAVTSTAPKITQEVNKKQLEKNTQADASDLIANEIKNLGNENPAKSKADTISAKTNNRYVIQLGVFKNYNDADQLKAQLILQGLDITIKDYKKQNITLYHVIMGPYPTLAAAKKQQHQLAENQIKSKIAKE